MHQLVFVSDTDPRPGGTIRALLVSLVGVATLTAGLLLMRQHYKEVVEGARRFVPADGRLAKTVSIERLRELGL